MQYPRQRSEMKSYGIKLSIQLGNKANIKTKNFSNDGHISLDAE